MRRSSTVNSPLRAAQRFWCYAETRRWHGTPYCLMVARLPSLKMFAASLAIASFG